MKTERQKIKVVALEDFNHSGLNRFIKDEVFEVEIYLDRYFLVTKTSKILLPVGIVKENDK